TPRRSHGGPAARRAPASTEKAATSWPRGRARGARPASPTTGNRAPAPSPAAAASVRETVRGRPAPSGFAAPPAGPSPPPAPAAPPHTAPGRPPRVATAAA